MVEGPREITTRRVERNNFVVFLKCRIIFALAVECATDIVGGACGDFIFMTCGPLCEILSVRSSADHD